MSALVLVDASVAQTDWGRARLATTGTAFDRHVIVAEPTVDQVLHLADELARRSPDEIIAIGGGSVLDLVRLARWGGVVGPDAARATLTRGHRGLVVLRPTRGGPHLTAIPTTLGTGAERSQVACVVTGGQRRLVMGAALLADRYEYAPAAYRTLPVDARRAALAEVALRVAGPYLGSAPHRRTDDRAEATLAQLLAIGDAVVDGRPLPLSRLAELSGASHDAASIEGRTRFSARLWYLANELSSVTGLAKMDAHALLLPGFIERLEDPRWAVPGRHRQLLDGLAGRGWSAARLDHLLARWLVPVAPPAVDPSALAERALRAWGWGAPMLAGFTIDEVAALYTRVREPVGPVAAGRGCEVVGAAGV
jgi:NADP-dependent alcohol dehydrogenase